MTTKKKILLALSIITFALSLPLSNPKAENSSLLSELPRTGSNPQVIEQKTSDITELPRTGIPAIAWATAALVPIGFKILKRGKSIKSDTNPNSLWTSRQFKKF